MKYLLSIILISFVFLNASAQGINPFELRDSIINENVSKVVKDLTTNGYSSNLEASETANNISQSEPTDTEERVISDVENFSTNPFELKELETSIEVVDSIELSTADIDEKETDSSSVLIPVVDQVTMNDKTISKSTIPLPRKGSNTLAFVIALISGLLLSIVFTSKRSILSEIKKSLKNTNYMKLFLKDERNGFSLPFLLLMVIYVLNISVFIRFLSFYFEIPILDYSYWYILLFVNVLLIVRHASLTFISYLRKRLPDALQYSFIIMMINTIAGITILPVNLLIAYGPESMTTRFMYLGIIIIVSLWILKWLQGFLNSIRIIIGDSFHFLLYLCACEIVPILICVGYVRNLIH